MSFVALATDNYEAVAHFYGQLLGFPCLRSWDRPNARGQVFDLDGLHLEILDARRESGGVAMNPAGDRVQLVIEVEDAGQTHARIAGMLNPSELKETSWGSRLFELRDPDGVPIVFLQWLKSG